MSTYFDSLTTERFDPLTNRTQLQEFAEHRISRFREPANDDHAALDDAFESVIAGSDVRGQDPTLN